MIVLNLLAGIFGSALFCVLCMWLLDRWAFKKLTEVRERFRVAKIEALEERERIFGKGPMVDPDLDPYRALPGVRDVRFANGMIVLSLAAGITPDQLRRTICEAVYLEGYAVVANIEGDDEVTSPGFLS